MLVAEIWEANPEITQQEIADQLAGKHNIKVTQRTVSRDLKALKQSHWQSSAKAMEALKNKMLAEYEMIYGEAIIAWARSLEDKHVQVFENIQPGGADNEDSTKQQGRIKAQERTEGQSGNPALLAQAQAALKAIREMFGVDASAKVDITSDGKQIKFIFGGADVDDDI